MVSIETQSRLAHLLKTIAQGEQDIEFARQSLARNSEFEPYTAFKRIDRHNDCALTSSEICEFLRENHITVYDKELRSLFNSHSSTGYRLSFNDFQKIVLPKTDNYLRNKAQSRRVSCEDPLPTYVESALARLLQKEIEFLARVEKIREDLSIRYDFGLIDAFELLDLNNVNSINFNALYEFVNDLTVVTASEVDAILIRFDKNRDAKLSYTEFSNIVQPTSPIYRAALRSTSPKREYRLSSPVRTRSPVRAYSPRAYSPRSPRYRYRYQYEADYDYDYSVKKANADSKYRDYLRATARTELESKASVAEGSLLNSATSFFKDSPTRLRSREASPARASRYTSPIHNRAKSTYLGSPLNVDRLATTTTNYSSPVRRSNIIAAESAEGFSGLTAQEKKELARFLKGELDLDRSLEKIKKELALQRKYNAKNVFGLFDTENKGYVTRGQFDAGLKNLEINATKEELYLIWRKLDKNEDGLVRFDEFRQEVEPVEKVHRSIFGDDKTEEEVGLEVRRILKKLLTKSISNEVSCDELRKAVGQRQYFTVFEAFSNLKKNYRGWINSKSFNDLLQEQGIYNSSDDAELLMIRFDRNKNGRVSYSEFVDEITQKLV